MNISVIIPVLNEEKNIARAVRSFAGIADQILVVDTGSTDRTVELAASNLELSLEIAQRKTVE